MKRWAGILALIMMLRLLLTGCGTELDSPAVMELRGYYQQVCTVDYSDMK